MQTFLFPAYLALNLFNPSPQTPRKMLSVIPYLTKILLPPTGMIGIYSHIIIGGVNHLLRVAAAHTGYGGIRFSFTAPQAAAFQVIFLGDDVSTAIVTWFILERR